MTEIFAFIFSAGIVGNAFESLIPVIAIVMVFTIPIVAIITEYFQKKNKAELLGKAIEKGIAVEDLKLDDTRQRMPYRSGMVCLATGIGVIIFGFAMAVALKETGEEDAIIMQATMGGGGALVFLIGVALLVNDRMNYKRFFGGGDR